VLKRSWADEVRTISVLVAIGVGTDGFRQILGVTEGQKEDLEGRRGLLRCPKHLPVVIISENANPALDWLRRILEKSIPQLAALCEHGAVHRQRF
jgi:hypothetical protein